MDKEKLEQWITKREIQKHSKRMPKKYKAPKTFSGNLVDSLDRTITGAEKLLNTLNKYGK
jgi:predicted transcriptional regulator